MFITRPTRAKWTWKKSLPDEERICHAVCIAGERACPPEDCGGLWGYEEFLEAIKDPNHEEHQEMLDWIGGSFDPDEFDLQEVNRALKGKRSGETTKPEPPRSE